MIVGGGFGGLTAAKALAASGEEILLVDRTNYHLFQPLLYQVATTALAPSDITAPIRRILRTRRNVTTLLGQVERVDRAKRLVYVEGTSQRLPYDYLILAPGARHAYFGHDEWEPWAPGLKSIDDARRIRRRFLIALERAEWESDAEVRDAMLTFVIVGGGPTGVELAGVLPEMCRRAFKPDFRRIDAASVRVILVEGGPRLLPSFPESLSERAKRDLQKLGVTVMTNAMVTHIDGEGVTIGDQRIASRSVFWAAGNIASPLLSTLEVPQDRMGRVLVQPDLRVPGDERVFVIGDAAAIQRADGRWVPGVAPAANQMGKHAAKNIMALMNGKPTTPFRYVNKGELATIGRNKAVASFADGRLRLGGFVAWHLWWMLHLAYLIGFRNRVLVLIQWAWVYFFRERGVRLITESEEAALPRSSK